MATVWAKEAGAERIIVPSDEVANDDIRKTLVKQATRLRESKSILFRAKKRSRYIIILNMKKDTVFYLFTKPQEVVDLVKGGVPIKSINIGGVARFKEGYAHKLLKPFQSFQRMLQRLES